jgi:hypothetical protein
MRDRLIELLDIIIQPGEKTLGDIADYLLENGVIAVDMNAVSIENRPLVSTIANYPIDEVISLIKANEEGRVVVSPCKVGDTLWTFSFGKIVSGEVIEVKQESMAENYGVFIREKFRVIGEITGTFDFCEIGKTVFLSKEEAEKALKGVQG